MVQKRNTGITPNRGIMEEVSKMQQECNTACGKCKEVDPEAWAECVKSRPLEPVEGSLACAICGDLPKMVEGYHGFAHRRCRKCHSVLCHTCAIGHTCP